MKHNPEMAATLDAVNQLWEKAGEVNRIGLVIYQSYQATQREAAMCATSETRFGNHGTLGSSMARSLSYEEDGKHILGSAQEAATRITWESLLAAFNILRANNVSFKGSSYDDLIEEAEYTDPLGNKHDISAFPHDPLDPKQSTEIHNKRRMYCWYWNLAHKMLLGVRKSVYKAVRARVDAEAALAVPKGLPLGERRPRARTKTGTDVPPIKYTVTVREVVGHRFIKETGTSLWQVELLGSTKPIWVDERTAPW